jgi:hypothetical protein
MNGVGFSVCVWGRAGGSRERGEGGGGGGAAPGAPEKESGP